jgi:hypothetical protein
MSTLTKIVSLAKKLKKEAPNKFAKWTDYIKEASAKIKPVVKQATKNNSNLGYNQKQYLKELKAQAKQKSINERLRKKFGNYEIPIPPGSTLYWTFNDWSNWINKYGTKIKVIGETKTNIKKEFNIDYTILLGIINSNKGNEWKIYQKDITKKKGQYITYDWYIKRSKDGLILSNINLPKDVSLYDYNQNIELIKNLINQKEMSNIGYKKDRLKILKKTTPLIKKYIKENKYTRAEAIRNANIDAGFMSGNHTDTNSHNVKLSIYSGVTNNNLNELKSAIFLLELYQGELNDLLKNPNKEPFNKLPKKIYTSVIKNLKNNIQSKKRQIVEIKKLIK